DSVGLLREQIDDRRAVEREVLRRQHVLELRVAPAEEHDDLELRAARPRDRGREPREIHEQKTGWEREVLLQEAIAFEGAPRVRQKRLLLGEADRPDRGAGQVLAPRVRAAFRPHEDAARVAEQLLVQPARNAVGAFEEETQRVERELVEREPRGRADAQANAGPHALESLDADRRERARAAEILRLGQLERPEYGVLAGA